MKSLTCVLPGSFEYGEKAEPVPEPGQAIIRIKRVGICGTDLHAYQGTQPFFTYPRILGHELAAELVEASAGSGFKVGESLTIIPYYSCGECIACRNGKPNCCVSIKVCGVHVDGGMVEYLSVPVDMLIKSGGLSYDELAMVEPFAIGAHGIGRAQLRQDEYVLVVGAGPIGLGTMQLAGLAGARVIALDINNDRLQFCRDQIKVPHTINPLEENVMDCLQQITNNDMPTVVIDATGNRQAINNGLQYLAHGGKYILIGLQREEICFSHPEFHKRESTLMSSRNATRADFEQVINYISNGSIDIRPYITHRINFEGVIEEFPEWLKPENGVVKAMISLD